MAAQAARISGDPTPDGARRVAIVMHGFSGGGMERSMLRLAEGLIGRGVAVDFVVGRAEGELLGAVPPCARVVPLTRTPVFWTQARARVLLAQPTAWRLMLRPRHELKALKPLLRWLPCMIDYLRQIRPNALLAAEPRYNLLTFWGRQLSGLDIRVLVSERIHVSRHASFGGPWGEPGMRDLLRGAYLGADAIVAVSDGVADDLAAHANIPRERITTVYNPVVGPDLAAKAGEHLDHFWFARGAPPVVLAAGRLDPQKDFATLLRAFAQVRAGRAARLVILGDSTPVEPAYATELKALVGDLGIAEDVAMVGFVDNPFAFMARASVFVLSSLYEGLPGVLIQALACGCPVVSTDCPSGPGEILDDGRLGPLVPVGDDAALARGIEDVLDDPLPAERLRDRARLFSVERAVDNYLKLLFPADEKLPGPGGGMTMGSGRRIAFMLHGFSGGGMERSMLRLADAFLGRGLAVDFVVGQAKGELLDDVPVDARVIELAKRPVLRARGHGLFADPRAFSLMLLPKSMMGMLKPLVRRLPSFVTYLRETRPDAILAAEPRYNVIAVWGRRLSGLDSRAVISERIQVSRHASFGGPWGEPGMRDLLRRAYLGADAIVAVSDGVADDLAAHAGIPRDRITTVYNPVVGPDLLAMARERPDHPWFAPDAPPVILAAGRLDPQKDFATLIRAFAQVRQTRAARLMILGAANPNNPACAEELKALPGALGVEADVAMPGFVDNPFAFMAHAAVFALSSLYEGLPGVLIQALACGCPVVSTDCPSGPAEVLDGGRFGPLVPVGDVAALARAIEQVLDHPPAAETLRARAELFSVQRSADNYLELLFPASRSLPKIASDHVARRSRHLSDVPDNPENPQVASHATKSNC